MEASLAPGGGGSRWRQVVAVAGGAGQCCRQLCLPARIHLHPPYLARPSLLQVKPYHFDFCCNVRQRWFGQNIIDIFSRVRFLGADGGRWGESTGPKSGVGAKLRRQTVASVI